MTVQHVVLFQFPTPLDAAEAAQMRAMVADWPARIGGFRRLRFGTDLNDGARARGYQFLLLSEHDDVASLPAYQQHPVHLKFADWVFSRDCQVVAFDFELGSDTVFVPDNP